MRRTANLVFFATLVVGSTAFAGSKEAYFFCESKGWSTHPTYGKIHLKSEGCEQVKGSWLGKNAEEKAQAACEKWARFYGIEAAYETTINENEAYCDYLSDQRFRVLERQKTNVIKFLSEKDDPSRSGISRTTWFLDNQGNETPLYRRDGSEQPQWMTVGAERYCGLPSKKVAFLMPKLSALRAHHFATGEDVAYNRVEGALPPAWPSLSLEYFQRVENSTRFAQYLYKAVVGYDGGIAFFSDTPEKSTEHFDLFYLETEEIKNCY